ACRHHNPEETMKKRVERFKNEIFWCLKTMTHPKTAWIYLPTAAAVLSVYLAYWLKADWYLAKGGQETAAMVLLGCAIALLSLATAKTRHIAQLFILVLSLNFLIREMDHQTITIPGFGEIVIRSRHYIFVALGVMVAWGLWKDERILAFFNEHIKLKMILLAMVTTYLISQLIAKRVFKHIKILPNERHLHVPLEEITENFAHTMFLLAAVTIVIISFKTDSPKEKTIDE
ncbi:MAG: hypothetical protein KAG97_00630, partial [Victivallales bacterium]|nr:hypothetical protein [Victivallales bacterium]